MGIHFVQGDARQIPLADGCVQTAVTSPPYWSLRDYGLEASIWGGDLKCDHSWEYRTQRETRGSTGSGLEGAKGMEPRRFDKSYASCKCGAWRGCLGLEPTPELFIAHVVEVMREVRRVLRDDGTLWLNMGDCYNASNGGTANGIGKKYGRSEGDPGHERPCRVATALPRSGVSGLKSKDRVGIPHMLAFAMRADGWYWRDEICWHKPNPMPESITDRTTKAHEFIFLFTKSPKYFYDADAIREPVTSTGGAGIGKQNFDASGTGAQSRKFASPEERNHPLGRNKRSVWTIATQSCPEAHFATFPMKLVKPCIMAGSSEKGCCRECGASWKRVVERIPTDKRQKMADGWDTGSGGHGSIHRDGREKGKSGVPVMASVTVAWVPTCQCKSGDPVPCLVLDPFNGAGTTGLACDTLGRNYVGVERKAEYIEISRNRLAKFRDRPKKRGARQSVPVPADESLFSFAGGK